MTVVRDDGEIHICLTAGCLVYTLEENCATRFRDNKRTFYPILSGYGTSKNAAKHEAAERILELTLSITQTADLETLVD